jgi:uncharacterized protein YlxW (UPF0749 family)
MLVPKRSWNLSLDSLSDTMTNGVGILILMLLAVTPASVQQASLVPPNVAQQAQKHCADLEECRNQLRQQVERYQADAPRTRAQAEALQADVDQLRRLADLAPQFPAECRGLEPGTFSVLLQTVAVQREQLGALRCALTDMAGQLDGAKRLLQERETALAAERELESFRETVRQLQQQQEHLNAKLAAAKNDRAHVAALRKELEALTREIPALEKELAKRRSGHPWPTGSYAGPYVLIECNDRGAVIYPEKRQLPLDLSEDQKSWLCDQVRQAGAALILARPSSFQKSYGQFEGLVGELVNAQEKKGVTIALTLWPIEEHASIEKYVPKGEFHE